jgi:hypothetical protein
MSAQTEILKTVARSGASLLRGGAALLDRAAGEPRFVKDDLTDAALAHKVESVIFRGPDAPRGSVDVNAVGRVVYLRGEVKTPAQVNQLVAAAEAIPEVERVEQLLHLPKTPAPTRTDTPKAQRKPAGRRTKPRTAKPRAEATGVTAERPVKGAEPGPKEHAATRVGRTAAPLGAKDPKAG